MILLVVEKDLQNRKAQNQTQLSSTLQVDDGAHTKKQSPVPH